MTCLPGVLTSKAGARLSPEEGKENIFFRRGGGWKAKVKRQKAKVRRLNPSVLLPFAFLPLPSHGRAAVSYCGPKRCRYSIEVMKDSTICALMKLPCASSSFFNQNCQPRKSSSGRSSG